MLIDKLEYICYNSNNFIFDIYKSIVILEFCGWIDVKNFHIGIMEEQNAPIKIDLLGN